MGFLKRHTAHAEKANGEASDSDASLAAEQKVTFKAIWLGVVASIGGFMFGYVR
jgi:MFS transporter, SP family, sugar:H+ symporter